MHPLDVASIEKQKQLKFDAVGAEILGKLVGDKHSFYNPKSRAYDVTHPIAVRNREVPKAIYLNFRGQVQVRSFYHFNVRNVVKAIKLFMEGKIIEIRNDNKVNALLLHTSKLLLLQHVYYLHFRNGQCGSCHCADFLCGIPSPSDALAFHLSILCQIVVVYSTTP